MVWESGWQIDSFSCTRSMVSQLHSEDTLVKLFIRITRYMQKVTLSSLVTNAHYSHESTKTSQHQHHIWSLFEKWYFIEKSKQNIYIDECIIKDGYILCLLKFILDSLTDNRFMWCWFKLYGIISYIFR